MLMMRDDDDVHEPARVVPDVHLPESRHRESTAASTGDFVLGSRIGARSAAGTPRAGLPAGRGFVGCGIVRAHRFFSWGHRRPIVVTGRAVHLP